MARRTTRQLIRDRLEQACRNLDTAASKLGEAQRMYFDADEQRGLELEPLIGIIEDTRNGIARWRSTRT